MAGGGRRMVRPSGDTVRSEDSLTNGRSGTSSMGVMGEWGMPADASTLETSPDAWSEVRESRNERLMNPDIKTNFELKYEAAGRDLYYLELKK